MKKKSDVTNLNYLKIEDRPSFPPLLKSLVDYISKYGAVPIIRILSIFLGMGVPRNGIKRFPECFVVLKDGTKLSTDIYLPRNVYKKRSKCPTILIRLPYWKESLYYVGFIFASHGYAVVIQDIRGCAHSEGFHFYLLNDREDGLETLSWVSKRFWYNRKVGMFGGSYFGMTQLVLSWDNNGLLTCIAPAICSTLNLWKDNGGLEIHSITNTIFRILINIAVYRKAPAVDLLTKEMKERFLNPQTALFNDLIEKKTARLNFSDFKGKNLEEIQEEICSYYKIEKFNVTKRNFKLYFKYAKGLLINQEIDKDTFRMSGLLDMNIKKFSQPAFLLAGWQDMFLETQLKDFLEIKANATGDGKEYSRMVIGPWAHSAVGHPDSVLFNAGLICFYKEIVNKPWYDYWLKNNKKAFLDINKPSLKYWVMGRNIWRYTDNWPPKNVKRKKLYIHSNGKANNVKGDGSLNREKPFTEPEDKYIFNPMNPVITKGGRNLGMLSGAQKQADSEKRDDVLVYSTVPLNKGIEITGPVKMVLYASSSVRDTDFMVKLVDVYPNGKALNILDAGIRARFRNGENNPSLIEPEKIVRYEINLGN
ncbi:MAG: CocE/NonD family hydrolase, partial [Promethearchaeota archaeon]